MLNLLKASDSCASTSLGFFVLAIMIAIAITIIFLIFKLFQWASNYIDKKSEAEKAVKKGATKAQRIGQAGEEKIAEILAELPYPRKILRNLYIPKSNGETTEIDLVFINRNGIFVIESKNYKGWIFGTVAQKLWTVKYIGGETQQLFNPIWQNRSHVKHLQEQLDDIPEDLFYSLIVFGSDAEIKTQIGDLLPRENIIFVDKLSEYIRTQRTGYKAELNEKEINSIATMLELRFCDQPDYIKQKHVDDIENREVGKVAPQENKCIICAADTEGDKLCLKCKKKLDDNGILIETSLKCILCGSNSGTEKICEECKKKIEENGMKIIEKQSKNKEI